MVCNPWRQYCDRISQNLIAGWCGGRSFRRALKTDVFDEAVGAGCYEAISALAREVHGIDVSKPLVQKVLREKPGFLASVGDVRQLSFPDASFDLIVSISTLDHFETEAEIEQALSEFVRILERGGNLLITLDNPVNPVVWLRNRLPQHVTGSIGLVPYFMGKTLAMQKLTGMLEETGFRILERRHTMHAPRVVFLYLLRAIEKFPAASGAVMKAMSAMEVASSFPTCAQTGHYSAVFAVKE